jgi:hypothetical protein
MSSTFETALKNTLANETSCTENGAIGYKTSGKALLDLNFSVSSLRKADKETIEKKFSDAFFENPIYAVKWLFFARDARCGIGERRLFRICFAWLANTRPEVVKKLIPLTAEFGRFDDLFCLENTSLWNDVVDYIDNQITEDYKNASVGKPTSLLAKWLPSCNTSSSETRTLAKKIYTALKLSEKEYRKMLSKIRANLKVIEVDASAKNWSAIDYEKVPSMANLKYKNAFLRNDETRRREYLAKLDKGEAKINSSVAFPCDIVHAYSKDRGYYSRTIKSDTALEAMWKALPNIAVNGNVLTVCDGSGSMTTRVSGELTALEVCNALGIYCAEHCTGPFKDKYITFSERPQYVDLSKAKSLAEKLSIAYSHDEIANTNLEAVFDLVLQTAVDHKLKQEDIPTLVILSDMEIDAGADFGTRLYGRNYNAHKTALMEQIKKRYEAAGFNLPRTAWWNIASRSGTIPLQQNSETGIILCSGYSQNTFKMLASNKMDPYEVLLETINVERYKVIEETVKDLI